MKSLTIIDTFGFLFRSYYALPPLKSKKGFPTGLLTGFMNFISNIGKDFQTDYLVFAFDSKGDTFRNEIYKEYKAHRAEVPQDLLRQLPIAINWVEKMGFKTAAKVGFEADDIIASIAYAAAKEGYIVRIVSHDKDLYQLIDDDKIFLFDPIKKTVINEAQCIDKYGIEPKYFTEYQSLLGDSTDNIPGVKGVGEKTAKELIMQYKTIDNVFANIDTIEKPRWKKLLEEGKEMAYISKKLVTLAKDAYDFVDIHEYSLPSENPILKISDELEEYDLNAIIKRVHNNGLNFKTQTPVSKNSVDYEYILLNDKESLFKVISSIPSNSVVSLDTETTSLDSQTAKIVGFSFCFNSTTAYYVPIAHTYLGAPVQISIDDAKEAVNRLSNFKLIFQNFKYDYEIIKNNLGISLKLYADTMVMSWLFNPSESSSLDFMAQKLFNHQMITYSDTVKKDETFANVDILQACKYASEDALMTYKLYYKLLELLNVQDQKLMELAYSLEFPFIYILLEMEKNGIKIDTKFLKELEIKSTAKLKELTQEIYLSAGVEFNINSPKQLANILFEHLQLKSLKKTKSGFSTNEQVLHELINEHEIIAKILEYREVHKLHSTYIIPLYNYAIQNKDNRIHTSFLQTGTATGRLSSKNPNLQNIPVRSELGREIRQAFIAQEGHVLVSIDYSQIELRLLAHFSKDESLVNAFNEDKDIHLQTAIKLFGTEDAHSKRDIAKTINFGLIYGMGPKKLSQTLEIEYKVAKKYIDDYFKLFPTVKNYLKSIEDEAQNNHFVKTLLERRRYFDFNSANPMQKAGYLREAVNSVFQGSAADLIKLAMVKIYDKYKDTKDCKMLLQIHDELVFEVKEDMALEISQDIVYIMENIYKLSIPLKAKMHISKKWSELK
ncbi:DNA polymerase I [Arcobacter sp. FWKO B]|uniref:DNA polymerase I n=1 Tax=Arcobacter sp. FWKO B TaxID=2593672 RepID=UPI0018A4D30E|nr:DNA polymerase I [Arcobacter sp. FWKO B]QOG13174.1 DNA polymerase I [Arcobacter sp. FWKO B]